jgi:hypothetical protein
MSKAGTVPDLPRQIVDSIVFLFDSRAELGLLPALRCSLRLLDEGSLTEADRARLVTALELIFIEKDYSRQNPSDFATTTITLVRVAAVKLVHSLRRHGVSDDILGALLTNAKLDPMLEVRFAVQALED